jgi:ABC-type lipoprotein export system ATPase subunit
MDRRGWPREDAMTIESRTPERAAAGATLAPAVELRDVFRVHRTAQGDAAALQGATLEVRPGEVLCVLGRSGAGKSTLLRVIAGLEPPSAGVVRVLGSDIGRLPPRRRAALRRSTIGFLDQHPERALPPDLPAWRCVELPLALRGVGHAERTARASELLDATGLSDRSTALARELAGGERQRLALCAALAHRPRLLLADEPTGELDEESAEAVRSLLADLARAEGATVIVVSHDPAAVTGADRAVRLRDGRVGEEYLPGGELLVIGRGGWLGLPPELLAESGIGERARVRPLSGGLLVEPGPDGYVASPTAGAPRSPSSTRRRAAPARVEVREVSVGYGRGHRRRQVFTRLSATFAPGRLTAVTGRSGAGKSTLLRLLSGLESPDEGDVLIDNCSLTGRGAEELASLRRARIGYLSQAADLVPFLAADENVALALAMRGYRRAAASRRAADELARFDLTDRASQRSSRLSAGEQQRVATARALASADGLLILDEPTSRLDEANAAVVAELLVGSTSAGLTVVCATNDPVLIGRADAQLSLSR